MQNRYNLDNLVAEFRHSLEIENFSSVTVKNNLVVAVGFDNPKAMITIGRR